MSPPRRCPRPRKLKPAPGRRDGAVSTARLRPSGACRLVSSTRSLCPPEADEASKSGESKRKRAPCDIEPVAEDRGRNVPRQGAREDRKQHGPMPENARPCSAWQGPSLGPKHVVERCPGAYPQPPPIERLQPKAQKIPNGVSALLRSRKKLQKNSRSVLTSDRGWCLYDLVAGR